MSTSLPVPTISSSAVKDTVNIRKRIRRAFRQIRTENVFKQALVNAGLLLVILVLGILLTLITQSIPSIRLLGLRFIWGGTWNPVKDVYGAFPFLLGTLLTSFLALLICIPFSVAIAIFLGEYYPTGWFAGLLKNAVELIAAVPSVIYGFWGLAVLVPMVRTLE